MTPRTDDEMKNPKTGSLWKRSANNGINIEKCTDALRAHGINIQLILTKQASFLRFFLGGYVQKKRSFSGVLI